MVMRILKSLLFFPYIVTELVLNIFLNLINRYPVHYTLAILYNKLL